MITRHPWRACAVLGLLTGGLIGAAIMYIAWQHNPQGAFHDESGIKWLHWFLIGASWFIPAAFGTWLVSGTFLALALRLLRGRAG